MYREGGRSAGATLFLPSRLTSLQGENMQSVDERGVVEREKIEQLKEHESLEETKLSIDLVWSCSLHT